MIVEAQVTINGSKAAIWAAITNIENASETISGIENIEVLEKPANGLVGLRWRETRMLSGGITLTESHESKPQGIVAKLMSIPMGFLFKGVAKKALLQDLNDIKSAVEQE